MTDATAQWRSPYFYSIGSEKGLVSSVHSICEGFDGLMYIGTNQGLYIFDGTNLDFYGHDVTDDQSIGRGDVYSIFQRSDSLIILGLRFGISIYNPVTKKFTRILENKADELIHSIYEDTHGVTWLGAKGFRLYKLDSNKNTIKTISHPLADEYSKTGRATITHILKDNNNPDILWLSVIDLQSEGSPIPIRALFSFNTKTNEFKSHPCGGKIGFQDEKGKIWTSCDALGIGIYDPTDKTCEMFHPADRMDIPGLKGFVQEIINYQNNILIFDEFRTYKYLDSNLQPWFPDNYFQNIKCLFEDSKNRLWIGKGDGIYIYSDKLQGTKFYSFEHHDIPFRFWPGRFDLDTETSELYVSTGAAYGFNKIIKLPLNQNTKESVYELDFVPNDVVSIEKGGVLISSENKIYKANSEFKNAFMIYTSESEHPIRNFQRIGNDNILWQEGSYICWSQDISDASSKHCIEINIEPPAHDIPFPLVVGVTEINEKEFYLYGKNLIKLNIETKTATHIKTGNPIAAIIPSGDSIFVSTVSSFFTARITDDSLWVSETQDKEQGFLYNEVRNLFKTGNFISIFGDFGLVLYHLKQKEYRQFGYQDGIEDMFMDPNVHRTIDDSLVVTINSNGILTYSPKVLWDSKNPTSSKVYFREIRVNGKSFPDSLASNSINKIELNNSKDILDISFQAISFSPNPDIGYSYRLRENDSWTFITKNSTVTFAGLRPGKYRFEVKAGKPDSEAASKILRIVSPAPFLLRYYVWPVWSVFLMIISMGVAKWYARKVKQVEAQKTKQQMAFADLEMTALRSQMNPHFMFNSLNSIKSYIIRSDIAVAADYISEFAHLVRLVLQNSRKKIIGLSEELEMTTIYVQLEKLRFKTNFDYIIHIDKDIQMDQVLVPPLILQPFVENAIWHGLMSKKDDPLLTIAVNTKDDEIQCIIEDNGIGRAAASKKPQTDTKYKSMGMQITSDRLRILREISGTDISVDIVDLKDELQNAAGTQVIIRIKTN